MKSAVIITGCWQQHSHNAQVMAVYDAICSYITQHTDIDTVWLNSEHINPHINPWYDNTHQMLYECQGVDWIRRAWSQSKPNTPFADCSHTIRDHAYSREQLLVSEGWQMEYMLNHTHQHIRRLYFFGVGWDQGMKNDAVGWGQVCDLFTHEHVKPRELVTVEDCVLTNTETSNDISTYEFATPDFAQHNWQLSDGVYTKQDWTWS